MSRPRLLDLFCCAGGAGVGYERAGFEVVGVDIDPQPHYPLEFVQADAIEYLSEHAGEFDAIHASPPCQRYTIAQKIRKNDHPDLVDPTRDLLIASGKPYVIENVVGSPLISPVLLCGAMFPHLNVYRHRLFESNVPFTAPAHPTHRERVTKMGRAPKAGERMHVVGNFSGVAEAKKAMGIDWMVRDELREAIPPAYTHWVGQRLLQHVRTA